MTTETISTIILIIVTFIVTAGIKSLSTLLGKDLSGSSAAITAGLVALLISIWQTVIVPIIPASAFPIIEPTANLIVVILGAFGLHKTVKSFGQ